MPPEQTKIDEIMRTSRYSYLFGRFCLEIVKNEENIHASLFSDGRPIALRTAELTILRMLIESRGKSVTTRELLESAGSPGAIDNLVHTAVYELRRTLHDADLIITVRSKGYCFTGEVEIRSGEVPDPGPDPGPDPEPAPDPNPDPEPVLNPEPDPNPDPDEGIIEPNRAPAPAAPSDRQRDPFMLVAISVCAFVMLLTFGLARDGDWDKATNQMGFIQALVILGAIVYDFSSFRENRKVEQAETEERRGLIAVRQFRRFWTFVMASWCCLYFTLFSVSSASTPGQDPSSQWQALRVVATFFNNASALMLVLCYVVLNRPTVIKVAERDVEDLPLKPGLFLVGGFGLLEAILVALIGHSGGPTYAKGVLFGADLLSGVAGGIAMALCISRLDSRLLGISGLLPIVPIVLYFYVVIQPFYPLLNSRISSQLGLPPHFDLLIMQLAFALKSVMYIYVTKLFREERFLFYMIHARRFYENAETEWTAFKSSRSS